MFHRAVTAFGLTLLVVGCTSSDGADPTSTSTETTVESTTTSTTREAAPRSIDAGRLVVLGADGNVVVVDPDGSGLQEITTDAGDVVYGQPIWSPDSASLSYSQLSEDGAAVRIEELETGTSRTIPMASLPFYMNWAPDGERIGVLHNGLEGLDFQVVDVSEGTSSLVDRGNPFYFSWSPDSDRVAIHEGPDRFEALDLEGGGEALGQTDPGYLVPQWLPEGILHISDGMLVVEGADRTELAEVAVQTFFVANPQGTKAAVMSLGEGGVSVALEEPPALTPNTVSVVDLASGEIEVADSDPAVGFWWSPDGRSLLMLTPSGQGGELVPKVWTAGGTLTEFASYDPSPLVVRDLIPFFPQYAQSMTFWAPDSSGFALAGSIDDETGIWVQALGASEPELITDGLWVAWSG